MMALATSSPYAVDGRCFEIVALGVSQWLSPTRALILNHSLLFETERPMTTAIVGTVIVRGIGGYTYEAAGGAMRTVPHIRMVEVGQRS
jgi:hypothetical protein